MGNSSQDPLQLEICISAILSFTTPRDVCRLAAVSKLFRAAAYSDAVWNTFLPPQCHEILEILRRAPQRASSRELYFRLCDSILTDGGRKLLWLERSTAKIGYMLSARALSIDWGDDDRYWRWVRRDDSRFDELAELLEVCWLKVGGTMDCRLLSADTEYRVVFVLKLNAESDGFDELPIRFSVNTSEVEEMEREQLLTVEMQGDGRWMEVIAGEFRVRAEEDIDYDSSHIRFEMKEVQRLHLKTGLLVDGVKIEPISN